ncbi:hypothetical protein B0H15DRAFT_951000 [Mycena belliarum]|uniref:Transmembrane protein n=1 Tax=Mycena belliarum TaxID=1033014 RepID=A0AAD6U5J8_9AGAR|nr:hypothetical protein B0H15DRAFT_951000 [Mycena belliae]
MDTTSERDPRARGDSLRLPTSPSAMMRPRYSLVPASDEDAARRLAYPASPASFDEDDEEEMLMRPSPVVYPPDPRFDMTPPPLWQRLGLILIIITSIMLAFWLQNGFWIGAII